METTIKLTDLRKTYDETVAVDGVSLEARKGEMFGLVGPDGAGKTSTIRVMCGLTRADGGTAELFGLNVATHKKQAQHRLGYLSQKFSLYGDLSIDENIEFFAEINDVADYKARRDELLEFTRLKKFRDRPAEKLSGGMKQKLALACALIHKPELLFLDEPTIGVDPVSRRDFWKILSELKKEGVTIFLTTPYLDEAERCERVALMSGGKIIALDEPEAVKASIDKRAVEIVCGNARVARRILRERLDVEAQLFGDRVSALVDAGEGMKERLVATIEEEGVEVESARETVPSLENVFIQLIERNER